MSQELRTKKPILRPIKVECSYTPHPLGSKCSKVFEIRYNRSRGVHAKRNNWDYWTEKEQDKGQYICNDCLFMMYKEHKYTFWENVTSEKKKRLLGNYVSTGVVKKTIPGDTTCCMNCQCCVEKGKRIKGLEKQLAKKTK